MAGEFTYSAFWGFRQGGVGHIDKIVRLIAVNSTYYIEVVSGIWIHMYVLDEMGFVVLCVRGRD